MIKLRTDFGKVELPDGVNVDQLIHGIGVQAIGEDRRKMSASQCLLTDGLRYTKMGVPKIREALKELGVSFTYKSETKRPENKDKRSFVRSFWGIIEKGKPFK